jgi:CBS domain-containing protein
VKCLTSGVAFFEEAVMKIKDVMTPNPVTCTPATNLAAAAALMLDADCGILPVVDDHGKLAGVVTDRDMYIALATRNRLASEITVGEVARQTVFTCGPDDDVQAALATMKQHRIRRLPVEGFGGTVAGIVSMNDIMLAAGPRKAVRNDEVVDTFQAICAHHHPTPHVTAA